MASHDMTEVEELCDSMAILSEGKIAFVGTVEQLGEAAGKQHSITIQTAHGNHSYESDNIGETLLALLTQYREQGETVLDVRVDRGSLERHFLKITKGA